MQRMCHRSPSARSNSGRYPSASTDKWERGDRRPVYDIKLEQLTGTQLLFAFCSQEARHNFNASIAVSLHLKIIACLATITPFTAPATIFGFNNSHILYPSIIVYDDRRRLATNQHSRHATSNDIRRLLTAAFCFSSTLWRRCSSMDLHVSPQVLLVCEAARTHVASEWSL